MEEVFVITRKAPGKYVEKRVISCAMKPKFASFN